jgi:hypothetical protein
VNSRNLEGWDESMGMSVEARYRQTLHKKFPYEDCYKLQKMHPGVTDGFIPDLDCFLSFIAGYSSSASRLDKRTRGEILSAIRRLRLSFFELYPQYRPLAPIITPSQFGNLFAELELADGFRTDLVALMEQLTRADASS